MTTFLFAQGLDPVELAEDESYNKARARGNQALTGTDGKGERDASKPMHKLSFKTATGGRISINPEKFIGVGSDEPDDKKSSTTEDD